MTNLSFEQFVKDCPKNYIISSDADGHTSALQFLSDYGGKVVGYWENGNEIISLLPLEECTFLDTEICRSNIYSIGHHLRELEPKNKEPFRCIQQIIRNVSQKCFSINSHYDIWNKDEKYPLGVYHYLRSRSPNPTPLKNLYAILCIDGVDRSISKYINNVENWVKKLDIEADINIKTDYIFNFANNCKNVYNEIRKTMGSGVGHISLKKELYEVQQKSMALTKLFGNWLNLVVIEKQWPCWHKLPIISGAFEKKSVNKSGKQLKALLEQNPISYAITGEEISYSLDTKGIFDGKN